MGSLLRTMGPPHHPGSRMLIETTTRTDPGPVRACNEDWFLVDEDSGLLLLADGMGGHAAGEVAARIAVDTFRELLLGQTDPDETRLDRITAGRSDMVLERMRYAMNQASLRIRQAALLDPSRTGMGTTLVAAILEEGLLHLAHVGDSRAYLWRGDRLERLTRDHTLVQIEVDAGRLTPELARIAPHKNILVQSIGFHGAVDPDTSVLPLAVDDVVLLCSDGLTDPLDDASIARICRCTSPTDLPDVLVKAALDGRGNDNVTVIAARVMEV
ncbi:MAG: serine/threonine-protein phosphatase [Deltaproteobacteria bacterium]|nr:serine/threonine-protein phosphatase [Deltaproteobacteria bacterium]